MTKYKVVALNNQTMNSLTHFEEVVSELLSKGWELATFVVAATDAGDVLYQTLTKEDK